MLRRRKKRLLGAMVVVPMRIPFVSRDVMENDVQLPVGLKVSHRCKEKPVVEGHDNWTRFVPGTG